MKPKKIFPVIVNPVEKAQDLIKELVELVPKNGSVTLKLTFSGGFCRRIKLKLNSAKWLDIQAGKTN
jgi:hypothetical protein